MFQGEKIWNEKDAAVCLVGCPQSRGFFPPLAEDERQHRGDGEGRDDRACEDDEIGVGERTEELSLESCEEEDRQEDEHDDRRREEHARRDGF